MGRLEEMSDIGTVITVTAILIGLFLVLTIRQGGAFADAFGAIGGVFTQGVGALMGPNGRITRGG